ncbi:FtsK/SpoIIIE domain-containing protein [Mycobacteroides abscessus]|uniref:FtsK/SpoIIIE domain-containing protein n=1 Tax=Mycobacteroides abscessus TaxID=36809 RepID=UPI00266BE864|nr:FtsK/SpoIIIE domain-containing protein [Mycobacteroides abscessus]MDO3331525.1 FtsK/SpoIIIE domain-containing protein [Mycobacteroides abscessus subsp. abscessus]
MASSNKLTRIAKELRAIEGISLSEAKRQIVTSAPGRYDWNLLGITDLGAYKPAQRWGRADTTGTLPFTIGGDVNGQPLLVDLADYSIGGDGPHLSIVGAPGNDGMGVLQFVAADLAVRYAPSRLQIAVFGGAEALSAVEDLPHVVAESTGLSAARQLQWIKHEIASRTETLIKLGVADWAVYRKLPAELQMMTELVLFIVLGENDSAGAVTRVLQQGRAVGIHVILCTAKPALGEHFGPLVRMTEPQTKEQVAAYFDQLLRKTPGSVVVGEPAAVPVGAGILTTRRDGLMVYNFQAYPPPPMRELAGLLVSAAERS